MKTNKALLSTIGVILIRGILVYGVSGDNKDKLLHKVTAMDLATAVDFAVAKGVW